MSPHVLGHAGNQHRHLSLLLLPYPTRRRMQSSRSRAIGRGTPPTSSEIRDMPSSKYRCRRSSCGMSEWMDNQDVCQALKISPRTLQTLRDSGRLPHSKINNRIYYRPEDVERLITNDV